MTQPEDRLRELFLVHENPIPDATEVYATTLARGRVHRRRRRAAQLAGGAAITASVAVGCVSAGGLIANHNRSTISVAASPVGSQLASSASAAAAASASASAYPAATVPATAASSTSIDPVASAVAAASAAAKSAAAQSPTAPSAAASDPADFPLSPTAGDELNIDAYYGAGYTYDDAVSLSNAWQDRGVATAFKAKIAGGAAVRNHQALPIPPSSTTDSQTATDADADAFAQAGYTYDDAVKLAARWGSPSTYDAKVMGGQKILDGQRLPTTP